MDCNYYKRYYDNFAVVFDVKIFGFHLVLFKKSELQKLFE